MKKIVYDYASRSDVLTEAINKALDAVYNISYPKPEKTFMEMCDDLIAERDSVNGDSNWRKEYKSADGKHTYHWPIDFFYLPTPILDRVWNSFKTAYNVEDKWHDYVDFLINSLFDEPGIKEVYSATPWSNGEKVRHCEDQQLLKDVIGEENSEKVKDILLDYYNTYRFGISDIMSFCGGYMSTPNSNKNTVINAWKDVFNIDIDMPSDDAWIDIYEDDSDYEEIDNEEIDNTED